jgi:hypothetical protein
MSLISQTGAFNSKTILALNGFSTFEFVAASRNSLGFERDFPGGSRLTTANSPLTWLYLFADRIGVDPFFFYYFMILVEIIVFLLGSYIIWNSLFTLNLKARLISLDIRRWSFVTLAVLLLLSNSQVMNLGNFGMPFFHGQFYGFSDGFRLAAIGFALKKRWNYSTFLISLSFVIHPVKGIFGAIAVFILFCFLNNRDSFIKSLKRLAIFSITVITWSFVLLVEPKSKIELSDFIAWTRVFQSHWYPLDLGVFSTNQFVIAIPFYSLVILLLIGLATVSIEKRLQLALLTVILVLFVLSFIGVAISVLPPNEFLIKLSLIRASELIVLLAVPLNLFFVIYFFNSRQFGLASVYTFVCLVYLLPTSYFFLFSLFGILIAIRLIHLQRRVEFKVLILVLWIVLTFFHLLNLSSSGGWYKAALGAGGFVLGVILIHLIFRLASERFEKPLGAILIFLILLGGISWTNERVISQFQNINEGREYLEVQEWAKVNSKPTDLFMVDPCINYGWRDFSERASLGTPREWFMTGWLYSGDGKILIQGEEIARTLGLNLDPKALGPQSGSKVCEMARNLFYEEGLKGLTSIKGKYLVDYFVLYRKEFELRTKILPKRWTVIFQNSEFMVIKPI